MIRRTAFAACFFGIAAASAAQAQSGCWEPHEVEAARLRDLQTMLMVGTLRCSGGESDILANYNRFVANNRSMLVSRNNVLKAHFMRTSGIREGARAYDSFATALANSHSGSARAAEADFCQTIGTMTELAGTAQPADLQAMAGTLAERPVGVSHVCAAPPALVMAPITAPTAPGAVAAAEGAAGPQAGPTELASVAPATAAAAQPATASPDDLKAATAALQAAVVALQAAVAARAQAAPAQPVAAAAPARNPEPVATVEQ